MAELLLAEEAEEARETPEPQQQQSGKNKNDESENGKKLSAQTSSSAAADQTKSSVSTSSSALTTTATTTTTTNSATNEATTNLAKAKCKESGATKAVEASPSKLTPPTKPPEATPSTPPTVKINGAVCRSNAGGAEKSPVDAISTWSEEGCHVFMPNWGETSSTNVSLLGEELYGFCDFQADSLPKRPLCLHSAPSTYYYEKENDQYFIL